jgi:hypothetical protein
MSGLINAVALIALSLWISEAFAQSPKVPSGKLIDENYRKQFDVCDSSDTFNGVHFPIFGPKGNIKWYPCKSDPSRFSRFETIAATGAASRATLIASKLGHDEDGSPKACGGAHGPTDQCGTSLMLNPTSQTPCVIQTKNGKQCVPVNAEAIPYVVIPGAAPPGIDSHKFKALSGVSVGDYGVVIANDKVVPVIVADEGPAYKIGEGSTALLNKLSADGHPHTISSKVTFILFPNTHDPQPSLSPDTLKEVVRKKGCDLYSKLTGSAEPCVN